MYYTIYKTTNTVNNKIYVGLHQTKDLNDGYLGSGTILTRAIAKYGKGKFISEILYIFDNREEMINMEKEIVNEEFINRNDTYNIKLGGDGGFHYINKTGKNIYENHMIISKNNFIKAHEKLIELFRTDKIFLDNRNRKISISLIEKYQKDNHPWINRKHLNESKRKVGLAASKHQKGQGNSQYGTIWIKNMKSQKNKKIKKEDLSLWLDKNDGWEIGRKIKW